VFEVNQSALLTTISFLYTYPTSRAFFSHDHFSNFPRDTPVTVGMFKPGGNIFQMRFGRAVPKAQLVLIEKASELNVIASEAKQSPSTNGGLPRRPAGSSK
jgi:hypothetical protein